MVPMMPRARARTLVREGVEGTRDLVGGTDRRRRRLRRWRFLAARHLTGVVAVDCGDRRFFVSTHDRGVALPVYVDGGYEATDLVAAMATLQAMGRTVFSDQTPGFVDIGANIGTATIQAVLDHGARSAIAYEPEPGNFRLLRHNILANSLDPRVTCVQSAVSDRAGALPLALADRNSGDHRIIDESGPDGAGERASIEVPVTTWDEEVSAGRIDQSRIGLVWIDTQGHEGRVLAGATQLLGSSIPIVIEYWPHGLIANGGMSDLHELMRAHFSGVVELSAEDSSARSEVRDPSWLPELAGRLGEDPGHWANLLLVS
jgi:FkbM family methyltransferase